MRSFHDCKTLGQRLLFAVLSVTATVGFCVPEPTTVSSTEALKRAMSTASPGDIIILRNGDYKAAMTIAGKGSESKPIVIKAETVGGVTISRPLVLSGNYLSLVGFSFIQKGTLSVKKSQHCRISQCRMADVQSGKWLTVDSSSRSIEIDHCLFENKTINRTMQRGCQLLQIQLTNTDESHHVHHNHFRDIPKGSTGNGFETLQLISKGNPKNPKGKTTGNIIEYNLFERCDGEAEIISVKSNGNILRYNLFRECRGALVLRHGHRSTINGNMFFGNNKPGSGGIRITGTDHTVTNNYFYKLGGKAISMMDGTEDKFYLRVERTLMAFNTFIDCKDTFWIGQNHSKYPEGSVAKDCVIVGNIFISKEKGAILITYNNDEEPEGWKWVDNIFEGALGIQAPSGIESKPAHLHILENGLAIPTDKAPSTTSTLNGLSDVTSDLFTSKRPNKKTLGAVQFPAAAEGIAILDEATTGP